MVESNEHKLKKLVKLLEEIKGRHTELVTVFVPSGYSLHEITSQLKQEQGTAENIKSKSVRKNVVSALEKIIRHLQLYKKTPENGLALFSGNVSEKEGGTNIEIWAIEPPEPLKTKLYWCDQKFDVEPLKKMMAEKEIYGVVVLDKSEADIALLKGKKIEPVTHFDSIVPGKTRAGGQCLAKHSLVMESNGNILQMSETHNPLHLMSVNMKKMTLEKTPITDKWKTNKKTLKISTKFPRTEIECSPDHTLFTIKEKITEKLAQDLKVGDHLLMPEKINVKGTSHKFENKLYYNSYTISKAGREHLKNLRTSRKLHQKQLAKKIGCTQTTIASVELNKRDVKIALLKKYCNILKIPQEEFVKKYCKPKSSIILPKLLTPELAQLIGYIAGDGSFEKERITLHERDKETILKYGKLIKKIFNPHIHLRFRESKNYYVMRIYGKPIVKFINSEFPKISKSRDTLIPSIILKSRDKVLAGFLKGFFDAEGYVIKNRGIRLGINNKLMVQQIQLCLLRFGIVASLHEYDNKEDPYSNNHRFSITFDDKESLEKFSKKIGFSFSKKTKELEKVLSKKSNAGYKRQIPSTGKIVRSILEKHGIKVNDFKKVTNFFRNEQQMSKHVFINSILKEIKNPDLRKELEQIHDNDLIAVKIHSIEELPNQDMVDISVENENFIANGLVVHNSSARFSRVREGMLNDFLKQVATAVNKTFLGKKEIVGIIVAGPGPIKDMLLKEGYLDNNVQKNVIGTVDIGTTGINGVHEAIHRGEHLLKEAKIIKEKKILDKFFEGLNKGTLVAYGLREVINAVKMGAVDTILITEDAPYEEVEYECDCGFKKDFIRTDKEQCAKCKRPIKKMGEKDIIESLEELAESFDTKVEVVSRDTREGEQFAELGGIGAILRYAI